MTRPDFFIVGAPKAGTTSLQYYLSQHPDVFMPEEKELHFFGSDLDIREPRPSLQQYLSHFESADAHRVGEASVWYLYSKEAAEEIHDFNPEAEIVVSLRNPVEMVHSLHSQLLFIEDENIEDFEGALDAESDRRKGWRIPDECTFPPSLHYTRVARYTEQLKRYLQVFGPDRVHVLLYDDLVDDVRGVVRDLYAFLRVDSEFVPDLSVQNPNMRVRSRAARRLIEIMPGAFRQRTKKLLPGPIRRPVVRWVRKLHTEVVPRSPMSPEVRERLRGAYATDIRRLEELLGRDLSPWMKGEES